MYLNQYRFAATKHIVFQSQQTFKKSYHPITKKYGLVLTKQREYRTYRIYSTKNMAATMK